MYKFRLKVLMIAMAAATLALAGRVAHLQIVQGYSHRLAAVDMLDRTTTPETMRGKITDRNGQFLAMDEVRYDFRLDYRLLTAEPKWIRAQERLIARNEGVGKERAKEIYRRRQANTWRIAQQLADEQGVDLAKAVQTIIRRVQKIRRIVGAKVAEELERHPVVAGMERLVFVDTNSTVGAEIVPTLSRRYPFGESACHIIGRLGRATVAERARLGDDLREGDRVGQRGVERMSEQILRGRRGYLRTERVSDGREVLEDIPPVAGRDVHLTIDIGLQRDIERVFGAMAGVRNGSAVVISVESGQVLAMVSLPTYDPNKFAEQFASLRDDELNLPLRHRAVTQYYPPGSIAKPMTALAGLTEGVIGLDTQFTCRGYLHTPSAFRCWIYSRGGSHGPLAVQGALKNSCNIFFYNVGEDLGLNRVQYWFGQFGYGQLPGTGLPEEKPGSVAAGERPVGPGMVRQLAIGQGAFNSTPLQNANAMATIARRGIFLSPRIVLEGGPQQIRRDLDVPSQYIDVVHRGMYDVCNSSGGTAYRPFHTGRPLGFQVCGKTGTAQTAPQRVDSNDNGRIDGEDDIVRTGDMAWFAGFAPYGDPQVAIAVVVEYVTGGGGSTYAAPIGREIFRLCKQYGYVK